MRRVIKYVAIAGIIPMTIPPVSKARVASNPSFVSSVNVVYFVSKGIEVPRISLPAL